MTTDQYVISPSGFTWRSDGSIEISVSPFTYHPSATQGGQPFDCMRMVVKPCPAVDPEGVCGDGDTEQWLFYDEAEWDKYVSNGRRHLTPIHRSRRLCILHKDLTTLSAIRADTNERTNAAGATFTDGEAQIRAAVKTQCGYTRVMNDLSVGDDQKKQIINRVCCSNWSEATEDNLFCGATACVIRDSCKNTDTDCKQTDAAGDYITGASGTWTPPTCASTSR